jgi:hypothetical protein
MIWGRIDPTTGALRMSAHRVDRGQFYIAVHVVFDEPLGIGLLVEPTQALDSIRCLLGKEDVKLGDSRFDPALIVQANRAYSVSTLLDHSVRAQILELLGLATGFRMTDDSIQIRAPISSDPRQGPQLAEAAAELARRVARNARPGRVVGPYR